MNRKIFFLLLFIRSISLISAEEFFLQKLAEFPNKKEINNLFIRKTEELDPYDDGTGSGIIINKENGEIYIAQTEMKLLYKLNMQNYKLSVKQDFKELTLYDAFHTITDDYYFCSGYLGRFKLFDKNFNQKFGIILQDYDIKLNIKESFYLEDANVLFFWDNKENIYSVVNPGMNKEENRKNFHNTEETKKLFESDVEINGVKVRVTSSNNVFINGKRTYWDQTRMNDYMYQKVNKEHYYIYDRNNATRKNNKISFDIYLTSETEVIESSALHPSGDIYVLRMNWNTNKHVLYRIENTWDPEWRKQWYEKNK